MCPRVAQPSAVVIMERDCFAEVEDLCASFPLPGIFGTTNPATCLLVRLLVAFVHVPHAVTKKQTAEASTESSSTKPYGNPSSKGADVDIGNFWLTVWRLLC